MKYDLQALDAALAKRIEEKKLPGVTVCIRGPEGVIFEKGYGFGDEGGKIPMNEHTIMGIASMSKSTVTLALCILAEGAAQERPDLIYLEKLPVFNPDGTIKG